MFVGITNTPRDYAWGSRTAIADLLGTTPSGKPEAELWLGTHPGSPSRLTDGSGTLSDVTTLPFLLKVLAAESHLSLQAHPNTQQAIEGFARENAEGIPLDAPNRNYRDASAKPELIYALEDGFRALCGFRSVEATRGLLEELGHAAAPLLDRLPDDAALAGAFEWLISGGPDVAALQVAIAQAVQARTGVARIEFETVATLAAAAPGDPGVVISLLLNVVQLSRGEVLYLPAGNIHAYLRGLGVELMAASDNVLRGGLTPKYVDVPELLSVLDFTPLPVPRLLPTHPSPGVELYRPPAPDFELVTFSRAAHTEGEPTVFAPESDSLVLCVSGDLSIRTTSGDHDLARGQAAYLSADEGALTITGEGMAFLAATNPAASEDTLRR